MRRTLALLAAGVLLAACASAGSDPANTRPADPRGAEVTSTGYGSGSISLPAEVTSSGAVIPATPAQVWNALRGVYADLGIEVAEADEASFMLGNPRFSVRRRFAGEALSKFVNCGQSSTSASVADSYQIRLALRNTVVAEGQGSRLVTTVEATARNPEGASTNTRRCVANDHLGEVLSHRVLLKIGGA